MKSKLPVDIHGEILRTREISGFQLTDTIFSSKLRLPKHSHKNAHFCLLLEGAFTEICNRKTLECKPMSLSFLAADEGHVDIFHSSLSRCFIIDIPSAWIERVREHNVELEGVANFQGGVASHTALRLHREFYRWDTASALAIEGLVLETIAHASRNLKSNKVGRIPPQWLGRARDILHERSNESLSHIEIASVVGVHPVHLAREFKKHYQCTIGEYVRQVRVEYACLQISTTGLSLIEIANNAGFFDQSHFSKTFKGLVGVTPAEYRRMR